MNPFDSNEYTPVEPKVEKHIVRDFFEYWRSLKPFEQVQIFQSLTILGLFIALIFAIIF